MVLLVIVNNYYELFFLYIIYEIYIRNKQEQRRQMDRWGVSKSEMVLPSVLFVPENHTQTQLAGCTVLACEM